MAPSHAAAEQMVVLGAHGPAIDETLASFLDEAIAAAAMRATGQPVLDAVMLSDRLKPAQLRQAIKCDAPRCWRALGEQTGAQFILSTRTVKSSAGLVMAARLVRVSDGKIIARAQGTTALDPSSFPAAASSLLSALAEAARLVEPSLFQVGAQPAAAGVAGAMPAPAPAPAAAAAAETAAETAAAAATVAVAATPSPVAAPQRPEVVPEVDEGFQYNAPTITDVAALLTETRAVDKLWNATWRPGIGFTVAASASTPQAGAEAARTIRMPAINYESVSHDVTSVSIGRTKLDYPAGARRAIGPVPFDEEEGVVSALLDVEVVAPSHWRDVTDRISPWLALGIAFYGDSSVDVFGLGVGVRGGLLAHAIDGMRGRTAALGPFVGVHVLSVNDRRAVAPTQTSFGWASTEYGLHLELRPSARLGEALPIVSFEGDLFRRSPFFDNIGEDLDSEGAPTFLRLTVNLRVGEETYLFAGVDKRVGFPEESPQPPWYALLSQRVTLGIGGL